MSQIWGLQHSSLISVHINSGEHLNLRLYDSWLIPLLTKPLPPEQTANYLFVFVWQDHNNLAAC